MIEAARARKEPLEHVLLFGPSGLGKTTLAEVIAYEMGVNIRSTSGPAFDRPGDVVSILTNLDVGDILFVSEIHRLKPAIEETVYSAMDDFTVDFIIGKGPSARTMKLALKRFTLIGTTTHPELLGPGLRERFGVRFHVDFYEQQALVEIVKRSAFALQFIIDDAGAFADRPQEPWHPPCGAQLAKACSGLRANARGWHCN